MRHFDLVIIGTGSGNSIPGPEFDDWDIAIVEEGTFGGTCLNVGCIPTKMFVYPADIADAVHRGGALGVHATLDRVDWKAMRDRIFGRIDPIAAAGQAYREGDECPNITVFSGTAAFTGHKRLRIARPDGGAEEITADRFVLAAGSRTVVPDIPGLAGVRYHTSDTVMRIEDLPARVVIIGGGYVAAEFGHIFASFGTAVTQIARGPALLRNHDTDISTAFSAAAAARYDVRLNTAVTAVRPAPAGGDGVVLEMSGPGGPATEEADLLLMATGRYPNGDRLAVTRTGVTLDSAGRVVVDEYQQTAVPGIWALGDISTHYPLKHVANHEMRVVAHNLRHPEDPTPADHRFVPAAVFSEPQIATVGITEQEAKARGVPYVTARQDYAGIAGGWARENTTGFCKVLADPVSGLLLGVHIIGPQASTIIQPAIQAMHFGLPARSMARGQYWIHPALPELLENALLALPEPTGEGSPVAADELG
jgi:mycothione reductase